MNDELITCICDECQKIFKIKMIHNDSYEYLGEECNCESSFTTLKG